MSINRFVNHPDNPFHTSDYVKIVRGRRIGSTSAQPFSQRTRVEANRQAIAKYRDSHIGTGRASYSDKRRLASTPSSEPSQPNSIPPQTKNTPTAPPPRTFQEPHSRGYNPYA